MESLVDRIDITENHRRLMDLEPGDSPEWLAFSANRDTIYAMADRVSEFMGEDGLSEDEALLFAYAERMAEIEAKAAQLKAMYDRLKAQQDARKKALEVCFENAVKRRAAERMPPKRKTLDTLFGSFRFRRTPQRVEWLSEQAAIEFAERYAPSQVAMRTVIVDKNALRREVEAWSAQHKGALPPGFEMFGGVESFSVSAKPKDSDE